MNWGNFDSKLLPRGLKVRQKRCLACLLYLAFKVIVKVRPWLPWLISFLSMYSFQSIIVFFFTDVVCYLRRLRAIRWKVKQLYSKLLVSLLPHLPSLSSPCIHEEWVFWNSNKEVSLNKHQTTLCTYLECTPFTEW